MKKNVGIIGVGNIGAALVKYIDKSLKDKIETVNVFDTNSSCIDRLLGNYSFITAADSIQEVFMKSDLIIESANFKVVPEVLETAVETKKDIFVISIGGLLGKEDLLGEARRTGIRILLPSGAISGVDALKASKIAGIKSVSLTTRKAPVSLKGAPYLEEKGIDLGAIDAETLIFEGNAAEAMKGFPKNINVSALLSIAGIGSEKTIVKIVVSPEYTKNIHEIEVISEAGKFTTITQNVPSPDNPKTSYLAALSTMAALEGYFDNLRIGT